MTRKYTKHSGDFKKEVIDNYLKNKNHTSYRLLGEKYNVNPRTISTWFHQSKCNKGEKERGNF
ncbi:MAG: hypothetical protein ACRC5R_03315 [Mycoplasmatales bacterium]